MLWVPFFLENVHFAINLMAAVMFFAVGWLLFDGWLASRRRVDLVKIIGYGVLSVSFMVAAIDVEVTVFEAGIIPEQLHVWLLAVTRLLGYGLIIVGLIRDPLPLHPKLEGLTKESFGVVGLVGVAAIGQQWLPVLFPILAAVVGWLYMHRATVGLEYHMRWIGLAFGVISVFELLSLHSLLQVTDSIDLYMIVAAFGPLWIATRVVLLIGVLALGWWVWHYLLTRFQSQLFMIFVAMVLMIFLVTMVSFTGLLLQNIQAEALERITTDVKVLRFAIDSKQAGVLSDAELVAQDDRVRVALVEGGQAVLTSVVQGVLASKQLDSLVVVNSDGQVLARGEDSERVGDSLSDHPMVRRGLLGEALSSVRVQEGALVPVVTVEAVAPINHEGTLVGAVLTGIPIDNAFVDGVKEATGLEAAVYAGNVLSATTLLSPDGSSRWVGIKEESAVVVDRVLEQGEVYAGVVTLINTPYMAAYLPLVDVDEVTVGMLFAGRTQVTILQIAGRSIELTFLITVLLLVVSIVPAYFIARYIAYQVR